MEWHIGDQVHTNERCKEYVLYCDNPILHVIASIKAPFDMQYVMTVLANGHPAPMLCRQTNVGKFNMYDAMKCIVHDTISHNEDGKIIKKRIESPYIHAYNDEPVKYPDDILLYKGSNIFNI